MKKILLLLAILITGTTFAQQAWIPPGSSTKTINGELEITVSSEWSYVGYDQSQKKLVNGISGGKTKVSCTCSGSGSCSPFVASGFGSSTAGCAGSCANCNMKQSAFASGAYIDMASGGYYSKSAPTRILKHGEQVPAVFPALFEVAEFQAKVAEFYNQAYGSEAVVTPTIKDGELTVPKGYALIGVSVFGRSFIAAVPAAFAKAQLGFSAEGGGSSCSCTKGSCSLKSKNVLVGSATWCEGSCSGTCTLSTTKLASYSLQIASFAY